MLAGWVMFAILMFVFISLPLIGITMLLMAVVLPAWSILGCVLIGMLESKYGFGIDGTPWGWLALVTLVIFVIVMYLVGHLSDGLNIFWFLIYGVKFILVYSMYAMCKTPYRRK